MTPRSAGRRAAGAKIREIPGRASASADGGRPARYGRVVRPGDELDTAHGAILYLDDITVSFDGFKALNKLTLSIAVGELRCIIGPNGAGKTTMMDVITGKTRPTPRPRSSARPSTCCACARARSPAIGIGRKFQKPTVFEQLTVFENLELRSRPTAGVRRLDVLPAERRQLDRIGEMLAS